MSEDLRSQATPDAHRHVFALEFDGAGFNGTQSQAGGRTVQRLLDEAVTDLEGERRIIRPASRLDAGVSARWLPFDCLIARPLPPGVLAMALQARLPRDIAVRACARVPDDFNARNQAVSKTYAYTVRWQAWQPVLAPRCWWVRELDHPARLNELAALLPGRVDLSGFACLRRDDTDEDDPVRTVHDAHWLRDDGPDGVSLTFRITGAGFLYKQIRGMVGAMVHVAQGRRTIEEFTAVVAGGRLAPRLGNIAPPEGLLLEQVRFSPEPAWAPPAPVAGSRGRGVAESDRGDRDNRQPSQQ